jgi:hypothetical protein
MRKIGSADIRDAAAMSGKPKAPSQTTDCSFAAIATMPGISLALTFTCNAQSISSLGPGCEEARPCRSKVRPESHLPMQEPLSASSVGFSARRRATKFRGRDHGHGCGSA